MKAMRLLVGAVVLLIGARWCGAQTVSLSVNPDRVIKQIDDKLYGHFLEHIYHSINGGLWGEVVWNRSFEEGLPGGGRGRRGGPPAAQPTPPEGGTLARHWYMVGSPQVTVETDNPLNSSRSVKVVTTAAGQGLAQPNYLARAGDALRGSLFMRGEAPDGIVARLVEGERVIAEQTLPAPTGEWKEYPLTLTPSANVNTTTLQILAKGGATIWLDQISLMPESSKANGGFRPDLLQAVADLRPTTIRWPGGSFVHTNGGYRWKGGIGAQSKRVGKVGWDELEPLAFGTDEFITLCKRLGAEPVIVVYLGSQTPGADRSEFIQEAADWVEYCNGPATSTWGAVRAANGHPEPYGVKYWEIDNEVWNMDAQDYVKTLRDFTAAMKKVDPGITTIACGSGGYGIRFGATDTREMPQGMTSRDADSAIIADASDVVSFLSPHHYENIENYSTGIGLAEAYFGKMGELIDKSKNPNFKIYFSEWNVRRGMDWRSGLYAGGILNFMERNKYITMACPALWLRHQSTGESWDNAFINFDHYRWFPGTNYVVMKLFRDHYTPNQIELTGDTAGLNVTATKTADGSRVVVKLVNPTDQAIDVSLGMPAGSRLPSPSFKLVAPDSLEVRNSFEAPNAVRAIDSPISQVVSTAGGYQERFRMPRWSVGVVELRYGQ